MSFMHTTPEPNELDEVQREGFGPQSFTSLIIAEVLRTQKDGIDILLEGFCTPKTLPATVEARAKAIGLYVKATLNAQHTVLRVRKISNQTFRQIFAGRSVMSKHRQTVMMLEQDRYTAINEDMIRELCKEYDINMQVFKRAYNALRDRSIGKA